MHIMSKLTSLAAYGESGFVVITRAKLVLGAVEKYKSRPQLLEQTKKHRGALENVPLAILTEVSPTAWSVSELIQEPS